VRAKTTATAAGLEEVALTRRALESTAGEYLTMAERLLRPTHPCLVALGGFSGAGKSTLALGLAPSVGAVPGAVVLRSDETRKRLCGVSPVRRLDAPGYSAQVSERVYSNLREHAALILRAGHSVVIDAVHARASDRHAIEEVAATLSVPFIGLWLAAPESVLIDRTVQRRNDASDANAAVIRMQHAHGTGEVAWNLVDASAPASALLASATASVGERLPDCLNVTAESSRKSPELPV
jgi:predicted kinase